MPIHGDYRVDLDGCLSGKGVLKWVVFALALLVGMGGQKPDFVQEAHANSYDQVSQLGTVYRIMIDPGHGGRDPGTIGPTGLFEKEVDLDVSQRLARWLKDRGLIV